MLIIPQDLYLLPSHHADPRSQRFGHSFFGSEAPGQILRLAVRLRQFRRSVDPLEVAIAVAAHHLFHPVDLDQVNARSENHDAWPIQTLGPGRGHD